MEDAELVCASEANITIPQMVIRFYESKIVWHEPKQGALKSNLGKF